MPRFFFDISHGSGIHRDEDGDELPDAEAARRFALRCLPDMPRDNLTRDGNRRDYTIDVRDHAGRVFYTVCMSLFARRFD